jgi:hypothetical protein
MMAMRFMALGLAQASKNWRSYAYFLMLREDNCFYGTTRFERTTGVAFDCKVGYGGICDKMMWGASDPFVRFWSDGLSGALYRWSARGKVIKRSDDNKEGKCGDNTEGLYAILAAAHLSPREIELKKYKRCDCRYDEQSVLKKRYDHALSDCNKPLRRIRNKLRTFLTRTVVVNDLRTVKEHLKEGTRMKINWIPEL